MGNLFQKKIFALLIIVLLIFISTASLADNSLSITRWVVDSTLVENGDLLISEDITFDFNDKFNGVYRNIVINGTDGIDKLEIYEMSKGIEVSYHIMPSANKGDKDVFTVNQKGDTIEVKIFSPSRNEQKTFRIKYRVKNVAVKHIDTGELYYKFLGSENSTPIESFSASVRLPGKDRENTKIFAHGSFNGKVRFVEGQNDLIKLEVSDVPTNTFVEARLLFPNNFINASTNEGSKTLKDIIDEELSFIEAEEKKAESRAKNKKLFNNISLITSTLGVVITGFIFNKSRRRADIYDSLNSTYPEDITPAELRVFMTSVMDSRALMTTIFDFARKEYITIEETESSKKKKKDFLFSKTIRPRNDLLDHEEFLLDWLFNTIGDGNVVSTIDIEKYRKKNFSKFAQDFSMWQKKVKADLKDKGYYDNNSGKFGGICLLIAIVSFFIGVVGIIFESLYGIASILLSIFTFIYGIVLFYRKSDKGYIQYQLWKDFKKDLEIQGVSIEEYNINIATDKILIYALALGLPMKSIDDFRERMPESYTPVHWSHYYFMTNRRGGSSFEDSFNSSFYGSSTSTTSSSIGGGGGFSGGGGGGAGGGGAGGF